MFAYVRLCSLNWEKICRGADLELRRVYWPGCNKLLDFSLCSIGWRRGLGRGGAFLLVSPLLGPLPTRSSRGEDGELDAALMASNLRFVWTGRSWGRGGNLLFTMAPTRGPKRQSKGGVLKALCVHAHFDDFEFVAAGTFELWRRRLGRDFKGRVIVCTDGKAGHHFRTREETGQLRLREQEASARIGGYEFELTELPGFLPRAEVMPGLPI